jgi:hypothetical protein
MSPGKQSQSIPYQGLLVSNTASEPGAEEGSRGDLSGCANSIRFRFPQHLSFTGAHPPEMGPQHPPRWFWSDNTDAEDGIKLVRWQLFCLGMAIQLWTHTLLCRQAFPCARMCSCDPGSFLSDILSLPPRCHSYSTCVLAGT